MWTEHNLTLLAYHSISVPCQVDDRGGANVPGCGSERGKDSCVALLRRGGGVGFHSYLVFQGIPVSWGAFHTLGGFFPLDSFFSMTSFLFCVFLKMQKLQRKSYPFRYPCIKKGLTGNA